jgi:dimethylhistidine N-methyltransferase
LTFHASTDKQERFTGRSLMPYSLADKRVSDFVEDVRAGLTKPGQKELPSEYLYDDIGSALFEAITVLPEYGLTRAGLRLLARNAPDLAGRLPEPAMVAELGSGSGKKARLVVEALAIQQSVVFYPIDISPAALEQCRREVGQVASVEVVPIEKNYLAGLQDVVGRRADGVHLLVLFLGSTIGNLDREVAQDFLQQLRGILRQRDSFLLSADLEKPLEQLLPAYNDPIGVTAAFNMNLLARINRELNANFNLTRFEHTAPYNEKERRIEMHLRSMIKQTVNLDAAGLEITFQAGETIWSESSHKFDPAEVVKMGQLAGFGCEAQWVDEEWPFAQTLFIAK